MECKFLTRGLYSLTSKPFRQPKTPLLMDEALERIETVHDVEDIASPCHFAHPISKALGEFWDSNPMRLHLLVTAKELVVSEAEGVPSPVMYRQDFLYVSSFCASFNRTVNYPSSQTLTYSGTERKTGGNKKVTVPKEASSHQHPSLHQ